MKEKEFYVAILPSEEFVYYVRNYGFPAFLEEDNIVPLCNSIKGAVKCLLLGLLTRASDVDIEEIKTVYVFKALLPEDAPIESIYFPGFPSLEEFQFVAYPGVMPSKYFRGHYIVDL